MFNTIDNNKALIQQLNQGSPTAFKTIYNYYFRGLVAFASQYVDREEAEGVVQDSMLWIWENKEKISSSHSLKSLLFTMVKNKSLNIIEHYDVRRRKFAEIVRESQNLAEDDDFISGNIFNKYRQIMNEMPPAYKEAFELQRVNKMSHKEIAEKLQVSPQTINYRISQALKRLRLGMKEFICLCLFYFIS